MAMSKKEQINLKLHAAKTALEQSIEVLRGELEGLNQEQIRDNPALYKKWLRLGTAELSLKNIMRLFEAKKKKQGSRMVLAVCEGEFKVGGDAGEPCFYKVRASMSMYLRGIPNCPDERCSRFNRPLNVEMPDEMNGEDDGEISLAEEIELDQERREKRAQQRKETLGR